MFLVDHEILGLIDSELITNCPPRLADPYDIGSLVQASSIDLTIGKIFVPGLEQDEPGGANNPKTDQHSLRPGETAVVETAERFNLPPDIAGFGFPPARVSKNGLLMTNPGHVDPGYSGTMSFTLVNMGREPYALVKDDAICTVLLFRLSPPPTKHYGERRVSTPTSDGRAAQLRKLSKDFLDVEDRAARVARDVVRDAEVRWQSLKVWGPIFSAIVVAVLAVILNVVLNMFVFNSDLGERVTRLESQVEVVPIREQVTAIQQDLDLADRITILEDRLQSLENVSSQGNQQ